MSRIGIFLTLLVIIFSLFTSSAHAQTAQSNCVVTKVGNPDPNQPLNLPPGCQPSNTSSDKFLQAALDLEAAYQTCGKGITTAATSYDCLDAELKKTGRYSASGIQAINYPDFQYEPRYPGYCRQCLGFISQTSKLLGGGIVGGFDGTAGLYTSSSFSAGGVTYTKVPGNTPQPGDIGVSFGHILVVYHVYGNIKFDAVESNWTACTATANQNHLATEFNFFRGPQHSQPGPKPQ